MSGTVNKVIIVGNLGKDPEIRTTQDGKEIANLTVATSEHWTDRNSGERKEKTEWHKVVVFNPNLTQLAKNHMHKGSKVYIEGQLQTRKWEKDGEARYATEVVIQGYAGTMCFLDKPKESNPMNDGNEYQSSGEIPF